MKLAILACHYNFAEYDMPVRNLHRFMRQMKRDGVDVFGIELYLNHKEPVTTDYPTWTQHRVTPNAILWQKERLLNQAESELSDEYDTVGFFDTDIWFTNPNWIADTEKAMQFHPCIQPFEWAIWMDKRGFEERRRRAASQYGLDQRDWTAHPGFAWIFRRDWFRQFGGWYDIAPMGAGDTAFAFALEKYPERNPKLNPDRLYTYLGAKNEELFKDYCEKVRAAIKGHAPGFIPGEAIHEWHGDMKDRKYDKRREWILDFDAAHDLNLNEKGYWMWDRRAPRDLVKNMKNYFSVRKEDG